MKISDSTLIELNPEHYQLAAAAAAKVVRMDGKLLGIPSVRPKLIEIAAKAAMKNEYVSQVRPSLVSHKENLEPMEKALVRAIVAARDAIAPLPPLRLKA